MNLCSFLKQRIRQEYDNDELRAAVHAASLIERRTAANRHEREAMENRRIIEENGSEVIA